MAVYVDDLFPTRRSQRWPYYVACHMLADTVEELHEMADLIGLKRSWFQPESSPHYDLTQRKRVFAMRAGAVAMDRIDMVNKIVDLRSAPLQKRQGMPGP